MKPNFRDILKEVIFKASRSGGAGGQHVNKVSTKVELYFSIKNSMVLSEEEKKILFEKLEQKITKEGSIQLTSQSERSQLRNKKQVIDKFEILLESAFEVEKPRKETQVPHFVKEKRLQHKKVRSEIKKMRKSLY